MAWVTPTVIILFFIPVLIMSIRLAIFKSFSFRCLTKVLNKAFVIQIIIGIVSLVCAKIIDINLIYFEKAEWFRDLVVNSAIVFSVIGVFFYLPSLILINIANWIIIKNKRA
jgi:hypothetical protein